MLQLHHGTHQRPPADATAPEHANRAPLFNVCYPVGGPGTYAQNCANSHQRQPTMDQSLSFHACFAWIGGQQICACWRNRHWMRWCACSSCGLWRWNADLYNRTGRWRGETPKCTIQYQTKDSHIIRMARQHHHERKADLLHTPVRKLIDQVGPIAAPGPLPTPLLTVSIATPRIQLARCR